MLKKKAETRHLSEKHVTSAGLAGAVSINTRRALSAQQASMFPILCCTLAFVLCVLLSIAPLSRIPDSVVHLPLPIGILLAQVGAWLPNDLGLTTDRVASQLNTNMLEFLLLIGLEFVIYGLCAWFILGTYPSGLGTYPSGQRSYRFWQPRSGNDEGRPDRTQGERHPAQHNSRRVLYCIWLGTLVAGCIYVLTPAALSHDIIVYASYSRLLVAYHANPYFAPLSAYPQDPFYPIDYWAHTVSAYGPIWLLVCAFWGLVLSPQPASYFVAFRLFALAAHLCNIVLVSSILRRTGQSTRTINLGTLLYAWNPLVLFESSNGGHNDIFMTTFILLGILLSIRAEEKGFAQLRNYLPALIAFTLAILVKYTTLPIILLFIALLFSKTRHLSVQPTKLPLLALLRLDARRTKLPLLASPRPDARRLHLPSSTFLTPLLHRASSALLPVLIASIVSVLVALLFYLPFWIDHTLSDIVNSFTSPPSANFAEFSILRAIVALLPASPPGSQFHPPVPFFASRETWTMLDALVIGVIMLIGLIWLWYRPGTRTFIRATIATLGALLIVTPWFYSWYVTWLVALAVVCLPVSRDRIGRALLAFALTFSISACATYLYLYGLPPIGPWIGLVCLTTIAPPLLAFLLFLAGHDVKDEIFRRNATYFEKRRG